MNRSEKHKQLFFFAAQFIYDKCTKCPAFTLYRVCLCRESVCVRERERERKSRRELAPNNKRPRKIVITYIETRNLFCGCANNLSHLLYIREQMIHLLLYLNEIFRLSLLVQVSGCGTAAAWYFRLFFWCVAWKCQWPFSFILCTSFTIAYSLCTSNIVAIR